MHLNDVRLWQMGTGDLWGLGRLFRGQVSGQLKIDW